ncbi:hypothetical protein [Streptomyces sp. NBC_01233]|uniref:hypothetical protein n=1 Tax=Streptomyces sp. NBC_01233 TaxID=2903787 RepID=UPI002E12238E|nr:hypothetical protein OG332_44185 [Streptomyces sp. NBC_01233]
MDRQGERSVVTGRHAGSGVAYRGTSSASGPSKYIAFDLTVWRSAEDPQKKG